MANKFQYHIHLLVVMTKAAKKNLNNKNKKADEQPHKQNSSQPEKQQRKRK